MLTFNDFIYLNTLEAESVSTGKELGFTFVFVVRLETDATR